MSRTPSANKNLQKANSVRAAGFKTYIHSIVDENGRGYYAERVREMFLKESMGAKLIRKNLIKEFPAIEPPSVTAIQNFCRNYALVEVPAGTMDASKRPDAIKAMYDSLEVVQGELAKAQKMQGESGVPLPMIRGIALNIVTIAEKIVQAEKSVGMPPVTLINVHGDMNNTQNNVTNVQQNVISNPQRGKELLDDFKAFEQEMLEFQADATVSAATK